MDVTGSLPYGIGFGEGNGEAWQMEAAHGGRGGVGIRNSLPCVAAVPPLMQELAKVLISGYGVVKPYVSVCRKATI